MNTKKNRPGFLGVVCALAVVNSVTAMAGGDRAGNGGDRVEPLFMQAQKDAVQILKGIKRDRIDELSIDESVRSWLKSEQHLSKIQLYAEKMSLEFQDPACNEGGAARGTSYDDRDPYKPRMCVSLFLNQATTPAEAVALVIHEAGHFAGETDHLLLSFLGTELIEKASKPLPTPVKACTSHSVDLRAVEVGFRCRTSKGAIFERVYRENFGEAWKGPDGLIWSDFIGNYSHSDAISTCNALGGNLPSVHDFKRGTANGFMQVLPKPTDRRELLFYWTSYVSANDNGEFAKIYVGDEDREFGSAFLTHDYISVRCVAR